MKPFWFAFNTSAWLSSKSVRMMSLAERGAYIGLLATAWGEDHPGTLPADEDELRRLAEMSPADWAVSSRVLLAVFPLSECGTYRYNPRLLEEAGKREELSEKKAEAGRKSAAKRAAAATEAQQKGNTNPTPVEINPTDDAEKANQLQIQLQLQSTNVDGPSPEALKAETIKRRAALTTDPEDEQHWSAGPLTKPGPFKVIAERLGFLEIDFEHYRKQALVAAEDANTSRTINQWTSWIRNFFNNQQKHGPLLKVSSIDLSKPTPRNQYPAVGKEFAGQVFVLENTGDDVMNRHKIAATLKYYPTAAIHFTQIR